LVYIIKNLFIC